MTDSSEEVSAYVTSEIKQKFKNEATDEHGQQGQSAMLREILRNRYANQEAEDTADELRVESRLEDLAARLMDDMADHREGLDDEVSLAAIYSIAQFEMLKMNGDVNDSQARDAIRKAKNRIHTDVETAEQAGEDGDSDNPETVVNTPTEANESDSARDGERGQLPEQTQTGFDLSWRSNEGEE